MKIAYLFPAGSVTDSAWLFGRRIAGVGILVSIAVSLCCPSAAFAGAITLGSAQSFAVLGGAGVAVNGTCCTVISGNLGDYPLGLSSITGFPTPGSLVNGSFYASDQLPLIAQQARADENTAYNALAVLPSTANESGHRYADRGAFKHLALPKRVNGRNWRSWV